jgi:hypothetical protein
MVGFGEFQCFFSIFQHGFTSFQMISAKIRVISGVKNGFAHQIRDYPEAP